MDSRPREGSCGPPSLSAGVPMGVGCLSWARSGLELTAGWFFGLAGPLQKAPQTKQRSPARGGPGRAAQQQGNRGPVAHGPRHRRAPARRLTSSWRGEELACQSAIHSCGLGQPVSAQDRASVACKIPVSRRVNPRSDGDLQSSVLKHATLEGPRRPCSLGEGR